jgi:hypothetical protein
VLVPELSRGDLVVMDNLSSYKAPAAPLSKASAPRSSSSRLQPNFDPIEHAFSKLKARLRKAAERTIHELRNAIGRVIDLYSPQKCANYFTASGYDAK